MFKDWSYKKRNIAFLTAIVGVLLIGYFLSIRKTWNLRQSNKALEESVVDMNQSQFQLKKLAVQKARLDSILVGLDNEGDNQFLLKQMAKINVSGNQLARYMEVTRRSDKQEFRVFRYEGQFQTLGQLLFEVERRKYGGSIASAKFEVEQERRTKVSRLFPELYFKKQ